MSGRNNYQVGAIVLYLSVLLVYMRSIFAFKHVGEVLHRNRDSLDKKLLRMNGLGGYFFTNWNYVLQIIFLITAILHEFSIISSKSMDLQKRLGRFRAFLFNALTFPCSCIVFSVFWTIWNVDRELIFPRVLDLYFPSWLNHVLHTFIMVPMVIELLLPKQHHFVSFYQAARALLIYVTIYQMLYLSVYVRFGVWLYPIYDVLNWPQRIVFTLFQLILGLTYVKLGTSIQSLKKMLRVKVLEKLLK